MSFWVSCYHMLLHDKQSARLSSCFVQGCLTLSGRQCHTSRPPIHWTQKARPVVLSSYPTHCFATRKTFSRKCHTSSQTEWTTPTSPSCGGATSGTSKSRSGTPLPSVTIAFTSGSGNCNLLRSCSALQLACLIAILLLDRYLNAKLDEERKEIEQLRAHHRDHVTYTRRRAESQCALSEEPSLRSCFLTIVIDGMDSKKAQVSDGCQAY